MKILFIGDIFGRPGRETVEAVLPDLKRELEPDLVIANGENICHGDGFLPKNIVQMQAAGVDFFTMGNHVWSRKEGVAKLDDSEFPVIRPANYPEGNPGRGYDVVNGVLVINLMGRVFMGKTLDCPFKKVDEILAANAGEELKGIFVDFHAETTSEKYALGLYLDGRVSAVVGTHTHVPTADSRVLPKGTAIMADAGMCGALDSVIGIKKELALQSFIRQVHVKYEPETEGRRVFNSFFVEIDEENGQALKAEHIYKIIE